MSIKIEESYYVLLSNTKNENSLFISVLCFQSKINSN